jgi:hypothetical protein
MLVTSDVIKRICLFSLPLLGSDDDSIDLELSQGSDQASEDIQDERGETLYDGDKKGMFKAAKRSVPPVP